MNKVVPIAIYILAPGVILFVWFTWIVVLNVSPIVAPAPTDVAYEMVRSADRLASAVAQTLWVAGAGFLLGNMIGFLLASTSWFFPTLIGIITPMLLVIRSVPIVVFIPIITRVVGYNNETVLLVATLISMFPMYVLVGRGFSQLPAGADDVALALGTHRLRFFLRIAIRSGIPQMTTALRVSASLAILSAVAAEWVIGQAGLGVLLATTRQQYEIELAWAASITVVVLSVIAFELTSAFERYTDRRQS